MTILVDNVTLLPRPYKEKEDIVILWVTEKEMKEAFPKIVYTKKQRKGESNKYYS